MPIYLHIFNLIVNKAAIAQKYNGGLTQFKKDFPIDESEINHEDDELISFGRMNFEDLPIDELISGGLDFDKESQYSADFTIVYRYGDDFWKVDWLTENKVFAWHKNTNPQLIERVDEICKMTMDEIVAYQDKGIYLLSTIKADD